MNTRFFPIAAIYLSFCTLNVCHAQGPGDNPGGDPNKEHTRYENLPRTPRMIALYKERLETVQRFASDMQGLYDKGGISIEAVLRAKLRVTKAELDLCEEKDRVALLEKMVDLSKQLESRIAKMKQDGTQSNSEMVETQLSRIEAELALEREITHQLEKAKAKSKSQSKGGPTIP